VLAFSASKTRRVWSKGIAARLRLVGEIFAAAIVRKRGEQALEESERRYGLATTSGQVGVWDWDLKTGDIYVDPLLKAILGYEDREIRNHLDDWGRLVHPDDAPLVSERSESHIKGDAPIFEVEHRMLHRNGGIQWFLARGHVVRNDEGTAVRMLGTDIDVTERKKFELELQRLSASLLKSQDDERRRLARELHDGTGQNLAAINLNLFQLRQAGLPTNLRDALDECQILCDQSLQEIRTLAYLLHPPTLDQGGLISALKWYVNGFAKRSGIEVDLFTAPDIGRLPREVEMDLFRIVQECLANVHRHSGSSTAQVRVGRQAEQIILQVQDQGHGIRAEKANDVASLGVGVSGMRERLRQLGGRLLVSSSNQGTTVTAFLPLAASPPALSAPSENQTLDSENAAEEPVFERDLSRN
jgi:two-component system, NarL family, sensor histidine kinase UhpB